MIACVVKDRNGKIINTGDKVRFSTECDVLYPEEALVFEGEVCFACGAYGIGSNDYIPEEIKICGNDNFVSFWELYNILNLDQFDDLGEYFELIEDCETCPFNSKCENQNKCRG